MLHLFSLFACAPSETPADVSVEAAALAAEVDCSGAAGLFDDFAPEFDDAIERVEITRLIAQNYEELFGLTLRSASSVTSASDRAANALEIAARLEEAVRLTTDFPELAPGIFGFEQVEFTTARGATAAVPAFIDATGEAAAFVAEAERAFSLVELQFPPEYFGTLETCGFMLPELSDPAFDTDPVGGALLANVEEAQALVAAIEQADGAVEVWLEKMQGLAERSSSETLGDADRQKVQLRFERAVAKIDLVSGVATFNDYPIADGHLEARRTLTQPGAADGGMITIRLPDLRAARLGVDVAMIDVSTATGGRAAIDSIGDAIETVHDNQAHLDAVGAVLELEAGRLTIGE